MSRSVRLVGSSSNSRFGRCQTISASTSALSPPGKKRCVLPLLVAPRNQAAEIVAQLLPQAPAAPDAPYAATGIHRRRTPTGAGRSSRVYAFGEADFTVQRFQFARQQLDQRRFPCAVARPSRPIRREPGTVTSLMDSRMMRSP